MTTEEVVAIAREKMGATSRMATGEWGMLARLLEPAERIAALVLAQPGRTPLRSATLLALTDTRLLMVRKGMITRREHAEDIPRDRIRGARIESTTRLVVLADGAEHVWAWAGPAGQVTALAAALNGREDRFPELAELGRRKFGRLLGSGSEGELQVLAGTLEDDESVLDLAITLGKPGYILALTPERVIVVPDQGIRGGDPPETLPLTAAEHDGDALVLGDRRFEQLHPTDAAEIIAGRIRARL